MLINGFLNAAGDVLNARRLHCVYTLLQEPSSAAMLCKHDSHKIFRAATISITSVVPGFEIYMAADIASLILGWSIKKCVWLGGGGGGTEEIS